MEEKPEQAAVELQKAIDLYPDFVLAHYRLYQSHMFDDLRREILKGRR